MKNEKMNNEKMMQFFYTAREFTHDVVKFSDVDDELMAILTQIDDGVLSLRDYIVKGENKNE